MKTKNCKYLSGRNNLIPNEIFLLQQIFISSTTCYRDEIILLVKRFGNKINLLAKTFE